MLRLLIIEGNSPEGNRTMAAAGLATNAEQYAAAVRRFMPGAEIHFAFPAARAAGLPRGAALADFDGAILGGSGLRVRAGGNEPAVRRQVDLVRQVFQAGLPLLGSCWGLQVAAVAAGGAVAPCARGREVGICRDIRPTAQGRAFPLLAGKAAHYDSLAIHYDEVTRLPPGARVLAGNAHSRIQAAAFTYLNGTFWGLQYHPEFDLGHMAGLLRRYSSDLVAQGQFADQTAVAAYGADLEALGRDAAAAERLSTSGAVGEDLERGREIGNWLINCRDLRARGR